MTRKQRIALEILGPPLLGGTLAAVYAWGFFIYKSIQQEQLLAVGPNLIGVIPGLILFYAAFAFPASGVQALLYAAIMEWCFSRGLDPRSWRSVALSTLLGFASGAVLAVGYGFERKGTWYGFNGLGLAVGLTLGLLIWRFSRPAIEG